ncbi:hypothetical protein [Brevibacterium marinum]|uniref:LPXTG-motif cell wall anchor domain-containing protein n=1 Tax=Brevibacterium marinum TaxID=418643 RepID=A0A846RZG9_9MICO|nr:hypothetical protein [Brevibacterium marinum]NJC56063.1 hypothetical protein [Brevibacterium marinum]
MKKLILAPAVALAFTGLVAAPVAAAEPPSTQSDSALTETEQAKADKLAKEKAEQKAEDEKAAEEKAAAKKEAAAEERADVEAAADKADEKTGDDAEDSKKPAPKDEGSTDSKKDDSGSKGDNKSKDSEGPEDPKDPEDAGDSEGTAGSKDTGASEDGVEKPNASVTVASSISAEDLAEDGLEVTVTHLEKGDKVAVKGDGLSAESTTSAGGSAALTLQTDKSAKDIDEGAKSLSIQVTRANQTSGAKTQSLNETLEITPFSADFAPQASVSLKKITQTDYTDDESGSDESKGVTLTVSGLQPGDKVHNTLSNQYDTIDDDDTSGELEYRIYDHGGVPSAVAPGVREFDVEVTRDGETKTVPLSFEIISDDAAQVDPEIALSDTEISESDFNQDGITVTGTGFTPNGDVEINTGAGNSYFQDEAVTADDNGEISVPITAPDGGLAPGPYTVTATDVDTGEKAAEQTFTVTDDAVDPIDASLKVDPKEITAEDLSDPDKGVTVTVSGVERGDTITDSLTGDEKTAEADGAFEFTLYYQGNPDSLEEGKVPFTVTIDREGTESQTLNGNINVVAEDEEDGGDDGDNRDGGDTPEAPAEASFSVSPKTLEAADFANDEKGVTLAVENCEPGADVHFKVTPKGIQVTAYENTVEADDEGKASVNVFGTSDNVSAYVGSYTASATCGDDSMKESFTVTAGADGGGNDDGSGGNDGSELPRTGADLGGLASGAMLLLVGGAAIAMTGRRKKVGHSPSDI